MQTTTSTKKVLRFLGIGMLITGFLSLIVMIIASPLSFGEIIRLSDFGMVEALWGTYGVFMLLPPAVVITGALTTFKSIHS